MRIDGQEKKRGKKREKTKEALSCMDSVPDRHLLQRHVEVQVDGGPCAPLRARQQLGVDNVIAHRTIARQRALSRSESGQRRKEKKRKRKEKDKRRKEITTKSII
jgi:hypothetical protein